MFSVIAIDPTNIHRVKLLVEHFSSGISRALDPYIAIHNTQKQLGIVLNTLFNIYI